MEKPTKEQRLILLAQSDRQLDLIRIAALINGRKETFPYSVESHLWYTGSETKQDVWKTLCESSTVVNHVGRAWIDTSSLDDGESAETDIINKMNVVTCRIDNDESPVEQEKTFRSIPSTVFRRVAKGTTTLTCFIRGALNAKLKFNGPTVELNKNVSKCTWDGTRYSSKTGLKSFTKWTRIDVNHFETCVQIGIDSAACFEFEVEDDTWDLETLSITAQSPTAACPTTWKFIVPDASSAAAAVEKTTSAVKIFMPEQAPPDNTSSQQAIYHFYRPKEFGDALFVWLDSKIIDINWTRFEKFTSKIKDQKEWLLGDDSKEIRCFAWRGCDLGYWNLVPFLGHPVSPAFNATFMLSRFIPKLLGLAVSFSAEPFATCLAVTEDDDDDDSDGDYQADGGDIKEISAASSFEPKTTLPPRNFSISDDSHDTSTAALEALIAGWNMPLLSDVGGISKKTTPTIGWQSSLIDANDQPMSFRASSSSSASSDVVKK